jgi:PadR family transcriptional regulator, regulatory protein AphA
MSTQRLSTTSYGILGLLAVKPWTTYELAQQMHRNLGRLWPRAESKLYEEPKKLVAHGYAKASERRNGGRKSTVYTITSKGRRALADWLTEPGAGPVLEFEQLMKVFFAEHGTKDALERTLRATREWASLRMTEHEEVVAGYLSGQGPYPERLALLTVVGRFLIEFDEMVERWASWAADVVKEWPEDLRDAPAEWWVMEDAKRVLESRRAGSSESA